MCIYKMAVEFMHFSLIEYRIDSLCYCCPSILFCFVIPIRQSCQISRLIYIQRADPLAFCPYSQFKLHPQRLWHSVYTTTARVDKQIDSLRQADRSVSFVFIRRFVNRFLFPFKATQADFPPFFTIYYFHFIIMRWTKNSKKTRKKCGINRAKMERKCK